MTDIPIWTEFPPVIDDNRIDNQQAVIDELVAALEAVKDRALKQPCWFPEDLTIIVRTALNKAKERKEV